MDIKKFERLISDPVRLRGMKKVVVQIHRPGSIGGTPSVDLKGVLFGFDWDKGKVILVPEVPLRPAESSYEDEISALKKEIFALKEENRALKREK